jgi:predicted ATPase
MFGAAVRAKIVALEERRWQVQTEWISARLALGQHDGLVPLLREFIGERPLDENLRGLLMTALYAMGRTGEALAAFTDARQTLIHELGVDPGPELRRVQAAMLRGDVITTAPRDASTVVQYPSIPHHLPPTRLQLVGREAELDDIAALVDEHDPDPAKRARVVVISGPPGIGKTAAAAAAAARVSRAFPHGQLYVDLGGSSGDQPLSVDDAIASLLTGFGIAPETTSERGERCRSLYRLLLAERRMAVVLDDAADAAQVLLLIPSSGQSLVIVTSRRYLAGIGCDLRLKPEALSDEDGLHLLRAIVGAKRVVAEPAAALAIVRACGGLPSAIEIAAARLAALPGHRLQFLADRLAVRDRVLDELSLDGLSLTDSFATSYISLDTRSQRCFRTLGMLDPDYITGKDLAEPLKLSVRSADRQLEHLVHEGLLQPALADQDGPKYRMPTVLHAYARTRLSMEGAGLRPRPTAAPYPETSDRTAATPVAKKEDT